ncbi:A-kinase anchor protein 10, mitochondrial-like [Liolophura sinensis]|uniref:A-kinase anchor protein 10, mitochondrial-like n=1 Tax=Liolophura sinensis TaxID=3198878 RepID=UPI003158BC66
MPFFKRNSDKQPKTPTTPTSPVPSIRGGLIKRTPSNRSQISDDLPNGDIGLPVSLLQAASSRSAPRPPGSLLLTLDDGDLGKSLQLDSPLRTSSRLSKTFQEILHDKDALPYFIQYMESKDADHLIRFWLDAESFQAATWTRIRTQSMQSLSKSSVARSPETDHHKYSEDTIVKESSSKGENSAVSPSEGHQSASPTSVTGKTDGATFNNPGTTDGSANMAAGADVNNLVISSNISHPSSASTCHAGPNSDSANSTTCANSAYTNASLGVTTEPVVSDRLEEGVSESSSSSSADVQSQSSQDRTRSKHFTSHDNAKSETVETVCSGKVTVSDNAPVSIISTSQSTDSAKSDSDFSNRKSINQSEVEERLSQLMNSASSQTMKARSGSQEEKYKKSIERDAVNIYSKYISLDATKPIGISEELRNATISKMCGEDGQVDPRCFAECQDFVVAIMEAEHYPDFIRSVFHCKHQIDVLTSGRVYLADCLYNEAAMFYFMEFIEQEGASNLLQFVMAADNFQQHLQAMSGYDGVQAQSDAMVLYDKYFSLQATTPLGFSDKIRFEVESNICREEGPLPDCFAIPRNIVLKSIEKNYFPQFLQSELYYKYLSELVNTIQMAQDFPQRSRKRTESDGSSEHSGGSQSVGSESISMKNTLLASDTRHWKKVLHKFEDDLLIDPVLLNPDSLWKRSTSGGMTLGKVDKLGQFVSEFEPEPDHEKKKSSGFFKKRREKDKEQEEMALRIAQTIISGVTSVTQGDGAPGVSAMKEGQQGS